MAVTPMIGEHGKAELEGELHVAGIKPGFERGFAGLALGHTVADLAQLTAPQAGQVRTAARLLAERESQARAAQAATPLTRDEVLAQGSALLGL